MKRMHEMRSLIGKLKIYLNALIIIQLVTFNAGFANEEKPLLFIHSHSPPFVIHRPSKEPTGIFSNYFIPMLKACDIPYQFQYYPDRRAIKMISEGKTAFSVTLKSFLSPDLYAISDLPIISLAYSLFSVQPIEKGLSDLEKNDRTYSVVSPLGFYFNGELVQLEEKGVSVERTPSIDGSVKMLVSRRVEYMINYDQMVSYFTRTVDDVNFHKAEISQTPFFFAVRKNLPLAKDWIDCVDKQARAAEKTKQLDRLFTEYFNENLQKTKSTD